MKTILALPILFCAIALPALGELTDADLNEIRLIVQEEFEPIKADIETLKTDGAVVKSESTNLKENVNNGFNNVQKDFDNVQKNFDRQNNIIIACIGIPLAILAISATVWSIFAHRRSAKDQRLENQIETLTQEFADFKQQTALSTGAQL